MSSQHLTLCRLSSPSHKDITAAIDLLMTAFDQDVSLAAMSDGQLSAARLAFQLTVDQALRSGTCYVAYDVQGALCGVSVWMAPGSDWRLHGDPAFTSKLSEDMQEWYTYHYTPRWEDLYKANNKNTLGARKEAWKLHWLGTLPQSRRRGVGKALVESMVKMADIERKRIFVEVRSPEQINYFERFGFVYWSVKNVACGRHPGFPIWCMVREPLDSS